MPEGMTGAKLEAYLRCIEDDPTLYQPTHDETVEVPSFPEAKSPAEPQNPEE